LIALPPSLLQLLHTRGIRSEDDRTSWLAPSLQNLSHPDRYPDMPKAVAWLRAAVDAEQPIAIYADRDVDGITGLTILVRSLRTLGGNVIWGNPAAGRGLQRPILEKLIATGAKLMVLVDCGSGETEELAWLQSQGIRVIVADHHRLQKTSDHVLWIHPGTLGERSDDHPAGCVMAFKLAQGVWESFLGREDTERLDYFLWSHLDILALGILADRVPLTGENRIYVWHGLRRLAQTRKAGLAKLLRFFRLVPRVGPITVREASWQIIPLLNAAGRLQRPEIAAELLLTEDTLVASDCLDELIQLNTRRRAAQDESLAQFEQLVQSQCDVATDRVLVALSEDAALEPAVTGLAAQSLARQFNRPAFLFVKQDELAVGSARGIDEHDLFSWVEAHQDLVVKFGGHHGAVGLTIRAENFSAMRERLLQSAQSDKVIAATQPEPEAALHIKEGNADWWKALLHLEPFGPSFPTPVFAVEGIQSIRFTDRKHEKCVLTADGFEIPAKMETPGGDLPAGRQVPSADRFRAVASPVLDKESPTHFHWIIQEVRSHG